MSEIVLRIVCVFTVAGLLGCTDSSLNPPISKGSPSRATGDAETAKTRLQTMLAVGKLQAASEVIPAALIAHPGDVDVYVAAATVLGKLGRSAEAAEMMVQAVRVNPTLDRGHVQLAIAACVQSGLLYPAIDMLRDVVTQNPAASDLRKTLVGLLGEAQLNGQIKPHLQRLIRERAFDVALLEATSIAGRRFSVDTIEAMFEKNPADHRVLLGKAVKWMSWGEHDRATPLLARIVDHHPDFAPAVAALLRSLVIRGNFEEFQTRLDDAPSAVDREPDYWFAIGEYHFEAGRRDAALAAFVRSTDFNPNDAVTFERILAAVADWETDRRESIVSACRDRIDRLVSLGNHVRQFADEGHRSQRLATEVAADLLRLGRVWEAEAWSAIATTLDDEPAPNLPALRRSILTALRGDPPMQIRLGYAEFEISRDDLPDPLASIETNQVSLSGRQNDAPPASLGAPAELTLVESSDDLGIHFQGRVGRYQDGPSVPLSQTLGCGGGALDFDRDGWVDLYFAAAGGSVRGQDNQTGAIFRSHGGQFVEVTAEARTIDRGFGQGVIVADLNADGFDDIVQLNFGRNRVFRNQGDGTFDEVAASLGVAGGNEWNSGGAFYDFDGDGFGDLIFLSYLSGDQPVDELCLNSDQMVTACGPLNFDAVRNVALRGRSDGRFDDVSQRWFGDQPPGRSLGILAGRLDGKAPAILVANDMSANEFWRWPDAPDSRDRDVDAAGNDWSRPDRPINLAFTAGLAVDGRSRPQASMGIAGDDVDEDGDLDLMITGFDEEYNVLYRQEGDGLWIDRTARFDLIAAAIGKVAFAVEAIDLDNDGIREFFVTNGHLGVPETGDTPYAQIASLYRRQSDGGYRDLLGDNSSGKVDPVRRDGYLSTPHVGRAVLRADLNRDGRGDLAVTHINEPVAVLLNQSPTNHHWIRLKLIGTRSSRDGAGAIVSYRPLTDSENSAGGGEAGRVRRVHVLAGHGYLTTPESVLSIGLGQSRAIGDVTVEWPDSTIQSVRTLAADASYTIIEGQAGVWTDWAADSNSADQTRRVAR